MTSQTQSHSPPTVEEEDEKATAILQSTQPMTVEDTQAGPEQVKQDENKVIEGEETASLILDWDKPGPDARNPMDWSAPKKWINISLVTGITLIPALTSTAFAPAVPALMHDFRSASASLASFTVSVYILGYCIGPLLIAPLSEVYGRTVILHAANLVYLTTAVVCAVSKSLSLFIVFRLIMGFAGCASVTLGGGVIADLMPLERRGLAMTVWSTGPILGPTIGPAIGGYLAERTSWRWIFWLATIALGTLTLACFFLLKETYGPRILAQIAAKKSQETGHQPCRSISDKGQTRNQLLKAAFVRPVKMLTRSPIVALLALYTSIINTYCTILFATIGTVFENEYNFSVGEGGLAYFGLTAGFIVGQISVGAFSDRYVQRMKAKHDGNIRPEDRLPPLILGSVLLPTGFLWYGWSAQTHAHWIVPILGSSLVGIASMFSYLPVQLYLVDTYTVFAASAIASNSVVRSVCAAVVPLGADPLYNRLGYGWGNSVLAFISLGFVPIAVLLIIFGERLRTNPRFQPDL